MACVFISRKTLTLKIWYKKLQVAALLYMYFLHAIKHFALNTETERCLYNKEVTISFKFLIRHTY